VNIFWRNPGQVFTSAARLQPCSTEAADQTPQILWPNDTGWRGRLQIMSWLHTEMSWRWVSLRSVLVQPLTGTLGMSTECYRILFVHMT